MIQADEKDSKESSQKENKMEPASSINSNFEPLSPDTSDSSGPPVSAEPLGNLFPIFLFLYQFQKTTFQCRDSLLIFNLIFNF